MTPASIIPVFGSRRPYADLNFAAGSFGLNGTSVSSLALLAGFTFTRASLAMMFDATGKLTYGPNNLFLQSEDCGNALWNSTNSGTGVAPTKTSNYATAPDGTTTAARWQCNLGGGTTTADLSFVGQGPSGIIRTNCVESIWMRTTDGSTQTVYMQAGSVTGTKTVTGTWAQYSITGNPGAGSTCGIGLRGGQTSPCPNTLDLLVWHPQIEAVTYQTTPSTYYPTTTAAYYGPRLVYDPVTLASQGILVEEARTNLCLQSSTFDNASWTKNNSSVTANAAVSPDGTSNADKLVEAANTATHNATIGMGVANGSVYTFSVYLKAAERTWASFRVLSGATDTGGFVNLSTGALGTVVGAATWSVQALSGGWYRLSGVLTTAATSATLYVQCATADNTSFYAGDGTSGIYAWQAQMELGTGASSPIPTTTASVTRAADSVSLTGLSVAYPLSIAAEAYRGLDKATDEFWVQVDAGASTDRVVMQVNSVDRIEANMNSGGVGQGSSTVASTVPVGAAAKAAARYATNSMLVSLNGALGTEDTTATTPATPSNLRIGSNQSAQGQPMYPISRIRIYNRTLSNAELQAITT